MKIDGILERAQLEPRTSDRTNTITGCIWFRTDTSVVKMATGSGYITFTTGAPDGSSLQNSADVWSVKAGGITTAKLADAAVTGDKLEIASVTGPKILDGTIGTTKYADSSVSTAKLIDAAVTPAKRSTPASTIGGTSSGYVMTSTSYANPTNASVSITTTGKPVLIYYSPFIGSDATILAVGAPGATTVGYKFKIRLDGSPMLEGEAYQKIDPAPLTTFEWRGLPCFSVITFPNAGSHTIDASICCYSAETASVSVASYGFTVLEL